MAGTLNRVAIQTKINSFNLMTAVRLTISKLRLIMTDVNLQSIVVSLLECN